MKLISAFLLLVFSVPVFADFKIEFPYNGKTLPGTVLEFKYETDVEASKEPFILMWGSHIPFRYDGVKLKDIPKSTKRINMIMGRPIDEDRTFMATNLQPGRYNVYFELISNDTGNISGYIHNSKSPMYKFTVGAPETKKKGK